MYQTPSGWRRLVAFALDYAVIAAYLGLLTLASLAARRAFGLAMQPPATLPERLRAHAVGFATLTLPVALYFAGMEATPRGATLGKRALGLRVVTVRGDRVPPGRALLRAGVKFVPWELAHTTLWQLPGAFTAVATPGIPHYFGFGLSCLLAGWYSLALFIGGRRTPYDHAAGTRVVAARSPGTV